MAKYTIEVKWDSIYEIEAKDKVSAIEQAIEWFQDCRPKVEVLAVEPDNNKTFAFYDKETGEDFFVEAFDLTQAITIAKEYFEKPACQGEVSWEEAEALGYDTYS